ncbi:MAG: hypothetical protein ACOH13_14195 [Flavobacteriales bacterium]
MILPPELPDTTKLRKALAQYVAINDNDDEIGVSMVLFDLETFVLIPTTLPTVDGVQELAFEHVVQVADLKVVHVYTSLEEMRPVPDNALIVPYCLREFVDHVIIPAGFTGLVVDPDAAHSVIILLTQSGIRVYKAKSLAGRSSLQG